MLVAILAAAIAATCPAQAGRITGEAGLHSSYLDVETFNDRFSDRPVAEAWVNVDLGDGLYFEPYVITGFDRPLRDEGSEYGFELGWGAEIAADWAINFATGRWANYEGQGFDAGDWFARVDIERGPLIISAYALEGVSDTAILAAAYEIEPSSRFTVSPVLTYRSSDAHFGFGVTGRYTISSDIALEARAVAPQREGERHLFASIGLVWNFGREHSDN